MIFVISFSAFLATLAGGAFALRFKDRLHLVLGFSAGAVIGVAFFDLLPEAIELGSNYFNIGHVTAITAFGFMIYLLLDRFIVFHTHHEDDGSPVANVRRGRFGAGTLAIHSFLDGVAIGLGFQVSPAVAAIVAAAVLTHDFSDGINTVNLILKNKGDSKNAFRWLLVDAIAPILGAASTLLFQLPEQGLSIVLALFAGFFFYIGAADLLPESHHAHPTAWTTFMTILGAVVLFIVVSLASL